jgi:signal transduction histidine kinase
MEAPMNVQRILNYKGNKVFAVGPDSPIRGAARFMATENIGSVLVTNAQGALLGIISERDIIRSLNETGSRVLDLRAGDLMSCDVTTCTPESSLADALAMMASHRIRHLPVVRDGELVGLISIRDVLRFRLDTLEEHFAVLEQAETEARSAKEAAERANRAKTEFLANMSHELKTPLVAVIGFAEVLARKMKDWPNAADCLHYVHDIEKGGRQLLEIVESLIDLSRNEIKALEATDEAISVQPIISLCMLVVSERADRAGVTLCFDPPYELPSIFADKRMLMRMLLNLLSNAIKFTPAGGRVTISCSVDAASGLRISVADTGIGISEENLTKVKKPFQQVETSISRRYEGAGLGLALVSAMMHAHGGNLTLESKVGVGTTATLYFPFVRTNRSLRAATAGQPEATPMIA